MCCAAEKSTSPKHTGFLSDYSKLKPDLDGTEGESYQKSGIDFKRYNKVLIDRILIREKASEKALKKEPPPISSTIPLGDTQKPRLITGQRRCACDWMRSMG